MVIQGFKETLAIADRDVGINRLTNIVEKMNINTTPSNNKDKDNDNNINIRSSYDESVNSTSQIIGHLQVRRPSKKKTC